MTNLHDTDGLVAGIVRNVGSAVEQAVDAVAAVGLHNRESFALCMLLNDVSKISVQGTGLDYWVFQKKVNQEELVTEKKKLD